MMPLYRFSRTAAPGDRPAVTVRPWGAVTIVNTGVERPGRDLGNGWIWILALGAPMFAAVVIDRNQMAVSSAAVVAYGSLSIACFAVGIRVYRPLVLRTWVAFGSALTLLVLGDLVWYTISQGVATVIFIAAYCCYGIGLFFASVAIGPRPDRGVIVDAALLAFAVLAVEWKVIVERPDVSLGAASFPKLAILVVYPVMDAALLALTLNLLFRAGTIRNTAATLLVCALGLTFLSHALAGFFAAPDSALGAAIAWAGLAWSYGLFAATAMHPTMHDLFAQQQQPSEVGAIRFVLAAAAPLVLAVLLVWDIATEGTVRAAVIAVMTTVCFALSGIRLYDLLALLRRAAHRDQAAAEALREQNARLMQLNEIKQSFVSMVSHELRTPLTSIVGYLEFLREGEGGELTDEQARFVSVIERNAGRLQQLVDDILQLGRADEGRIKLNVEPVDVARLMQRAAESAGPVAERRGLALTVEVAPELPDLEGDRRLLAEALDNLVSNAIKFTRTGGTVTIRARTAGEGVELEVQDSGVGIPADELPHLFERFFRASTAVASGTGLGLAIARSIVDLHGGTISVESTVGVGSTFRLRLPLAPPATSQPRETEKLEA
jgi:signal transduction histidine kinase